MNPCVTFFEGDYGTCNTWTDTRWVNNPTRQDRVTGKRLTRAACRVLTQWPGPPGHVHPVWRDTRRDRQMDQVRAYLSGTTPVPACRWARTLPLLSGRFGHLPWRAVPGKIHAGQAAAPMARTRVMPWMLAYCQRIELLQTICVRLLHEEK